MGVELGEIGFGASLAIGIGLWLLCLMAACVVAWVWASAREERRAAEKRMRGG